MSVVAAAVVPHSPLLLPTIAKQHRSLVSRNTTAIASLAAEWYAAKPDVVLILSPHGLTNDQPLVIHSAEHFQGSFSEFGDVSTTVTATGAVGFMHHLKSAAEAEYLDLHLQTFEQLDYGTSVPLFFVLAAQPKLPLCSVVINTQDSDRLLRFAATMRESIISDHRRFLVIASCDMSRRKSKTTETRPRPTAEERAFSSAIVAVDAAQLTAITPQASTCGYGPLLVLVSALSGVAIRGHIEAFEAPLGVGLMTASFSFNP